ncbi:hypothetical protein FRC08_008363 [Ceratobasidium sp. 394]|nr:hypothetical protein FRC08_008363 [Ceratobasidium sp. 394]
MPAFHSAEQRSSPSTTAWRGRWAAVRCMNMPKDRSCANCPVIVEVSLPEGWYPRYGIVIGPPEPGAESEGANSVESIETLSVQHERDTLHLDGALPPIAVLEVEDAGVDDDEDREWEGEGDEGDGEGDEEGDDEGEIDELMFDTSD